MRFEYKQIVQDRPIAKIELDKLGDDSWELVGLSSFMQTEVNRYLCCVFKRSKGPTPLIKTVDESIAALKDATEAFEK